MRDNNNKEVAMAMKANLQSIVEMGKAVYRVERVFSGEKTASELIADAAIRHSDLMRDGDFSHPVNPLTDDPQHDTMPHVGSVRIEGDI